MHSVLIKGGVLISRCVLIERLHCTWQGFIQDFWLGVGETCQYLNKSYLGGSGGMLPQKIFEF